MGAVYTYGTALVELQLRLANRTDLGTRLNNWLDLAQIRLASAKVSMETLDVVGAPFATVAGQSTYTNAGGITGIIGFMSIRNDTTGVKLRKFPWTDFRSLNQQATGGDLRWARWGDTIALDPQPDGVYNHLIDYRREPQLGVIEVPNRYQNELIDGAVYLGWMALRQFDQARMVLTGMPVEIATAFQQPLDRSQWESLWDIDLAMRPAGFDSPFSIYGGY